MFNKQDSLRFYKQQHLYSAILECLADKHGIKYDEFLGRIGLTMDYELKWSITIKEIADSILYLGQIDLLEVDENKIIKLTGKGIEALQRCTFTQLATNSYFNYQGLKNNSISIFIASISIIIALIALFLKQCN